MEAFYPTILLIVATIISNIVASKFDKIPLNFFQILSGLILSLLPSFHNYTLYPEVFMILIIAPLLFNDGRNTDLSHFRSSISQLFSLAVILAFVTAISVGFFTHSIMPIIPLSLCFALAAIVTPTDSLALSSITADVKIPAEINTALESESLFNDASGIVIFNLAISAFMEGNFSITHGVFNFVIQFFGGIVVGLFAGVIFIKIRTVLVNNSMDTASVVIPFSLMTPIATYLLGEELGCSGILAAVTAGVVYGVNQNKLRLTSTNVQLMEQSAWTIVTRTLSGIVFVLLGVTLPTVFKRVIDYSDKYLWELTGLALAIYLLMLLIRFLWVILNFVQLDPNGKKATAKEAFITAISGVHGTITLSMALSIPFTMAMGTKAFPFRDTLIYIAAIVILISLVAPILILPKLLPRKRNDGAVLFQKQRNRMINYAIHEIKQNNKVNLTDRNYVIEMLNSQRQQQRLNRKEIQKIRKQVMVVEKEAIINLLSAGRIPQSTANIIARRALINPYESGGFISRISFWFKIHFFRHKRKKQVRAMKSRVPEQRLEQIQQEHLKAKKQIDDYLFIKVNDYLDAIESDTNTTTVEFIRSGYNYRSRRTNNTDDSNQQQNHLLIQGFQFEHNYVTAALEKQNIDKDMADNLNTSITTDEMVFLQSLSDDD